MEYVAVFLISFIVGWATSHFLNLRNERDSYRAKLRREMEHVVRLNKMQRLEKARPLPSVPRKALRG